MEQLSLLQKIYLYGETLSSEELNQIVLYLNSSIEAINTLIARNNNINEGHCEMRYKVSAQLPEAPESGTDGKSNGWSDTYTKPDTANGEITWMTLSFFNGEGIYGAWSTPVCITWGSVQGQKGPKGDSGLKGSFKSRVFKRLNSRPDTPTGGTYDNPIPPEGGWTDGIPSGATIIWSSVCTFYGNGLSSGWSVPAPESDSDTLDIEFSPSSVQPEPPTGNTPFANHESEGWYDPSSDQFNIVGTMIWRAERKVSNGEYNGEWTITRIVGEKGPKGDSGLTGGHYEFRYNNFKPSTQASAPTKPSDGSNGTTGGWTTSQETLTETLIKDGYATWMTQCYQNENSIYGTWSDPIRITGANGYDGADGNEIEFVYTRNNTGVTPAAPPTTQQEDWTGTVEGITWTDNPQGVLENMMYEYVSLRAKINDVWSAYSTPVIWSKWGEKGMDGDGYEYIYKRFTTPQTFTKANAEDATSGNPEDWPTSLDREYKGTNTGWSDDPLGIDETYKYEYVSCRQRIDEVWGKFNKPTLWSGIPGGKEEFRYANATSTPTKPTAGSSGIDNTWKATQSALSESDIKSGYKTYMTHCFKTDAGTYGTWSDPVRITGANGLDGEDGSDVEFIYTRNNTGSTPSAPTASGTGNTKTFSGDDWYGLDNNGVTWTDNPTGVASDNKYEYVAVREKPAGNNQRWGDYHVALWSKWGEKGMDGDGYEYIYKHFSTEQTWGNDNNNPNFWDANLNREYYGPSGYTWSDDPTGIDSTNKFEYVSTRQRIDGTWLKFSTPVLWSNYAEPGATVLGPQGKLGPMSYLAGIWNSGTTYTKTETMNPIVYYETGDSYYYLKDIGSSIGENPSTSNKWAEAENYNTVFTDILFVGTFSKLGHFIVNTDWLITMHGTIYDANGTAHNINETDTWVYDGTTYTLNNAYLLFKSDYPQSNKPSEPNFVPNAAIDARTGESYFNNAHITGEVTATSGTFNGTVNASGGMFNGVINASQFKAGNDSGFSISTSADSLDFNYNGARLAFFSLRGWDSTNNQLADVSSTPTGFYLYMTNPLDGHLITIDFNSLAFTDLTPNTATRHELTFYSILNNGTNSPNIQSRILYYSVENNVTKWWNHSDSSTELTSQEMGTLYKKYTFVTRGGESYGNCVLKIGTNSYKTTPITLYEEYTLQNSVPTKTGNYVLTTQLASDGTSTSNYYFVMPDSSATLTSQNTNYNLITISSGPVLSTTATCVSKGSYSGVPTFNSSNPISLFSKIDADGNPVSILYPGPSLNL